MSLWPYSGSPRTNLLDMGQVQAERASLGFPHSDATGPAKDVMTPEIVKRYSAPVPRYTSYPTAPHFKPTVGADKHREWITALPDGAKLSLYFHIPYCHSLCWYCGCTTKATARAEAGDLYLPTLLTETRHVAELLPPHEITHIHWGGGSPNILTADGIARLAGAIREGFRLSRDTEFAVEIDPRSLSEDQADAFAMAGVSRVSLGVQDFDPEVQRAINRFQPFEMTERAVELFRARGVESINVDLVYGLPHQTRDSVQRTIEQTLSLEPDRIAIFGYAHLPSRFKHQQLIPDAALPDIVERYGQSQRLSRTLAKAGYVRVGLDHYARPGDKLAEPGVRRNFQGYTSDTAETLIGLGASSISRFPQGYTQNAPATPDYKARIDKTGLATVRGLEMSLDDKMRAAVIERLMCTFDFSCNDLMAEFGEAARPILADAEAVIDSDRDGFVRRTADGFEVTDTGRPFVRTIAACFDVYLGQGNAIHAIAV